MKTKPDVRGCGLVVLPLCAITTVCLIAFDLVIVGSTSSPRPPPPPYQVNSVEQVCQIFDIPPTDDFCLNPSEQQWNTLEAALKRRFPVGQATFSQVMDNLEVTCIDFSKDPKKFGTFSAIAATFQEFAGANCPGTSDTDDFYTCYIYFKHDILPITVHFEPTTDVVLRMAVGRTGT